METIAPTKANSDAAVESTGNKPEKVFRHRNLSASIFRNEAKSGGKFYSVVMQRAYKDGDEFKHSSSFTRDELPIARHLLQQAWEFVLDTESRKNVE